MVTYTAHMNRSTRSPTRTLVICICLSVRAYLQVGSVVAVKLGTSVVRARANPPLLCHQVSVNGHAILFDVTHAKPNPMTPHIPILTRKGSCTLHKKRIGTVERVKSVAAAIAIPRQLVINRGKIVVF